jgi:hypothetical protein
MTGEQGNVIKKSSFDLVLSTIGHDFPACPGSARCTDDQELVSWIEIKGQPGDHARGSSLTVIILPVLHD